ncbi:D-3-phosphoglycerate dehydrogenase [Rosistilla oblonga]|uniref:D-2-hydroxyacid dehydrogenase n=1 Tax=Rosistilla oblonga TaxID=2527990 RepID=UPI0011887B4A|nr:D-2-hydroxyacid dehydrogenase [Rosistilla oblonga]QDV12839.1 D-3-phosphoglycerate dehydrogenase [Rosistilla oblonga]
MRIVLCYPVEPHHIAQIQAAAPDFEVVDAGQERIDELLPTADIFIGHAKVPVDWDRVLKANRLRWIQSSAAGLDHCLVPGVIDAEIVVSSASGLFAPQVAEQTMTLLLDLIRSQGRFNRANSRHEFIRLPTDDLRQKKVGIVGLGGNGRRIAKVLKPFDVSIVATDYFSFDPPPEVDRLLPADAVDEMLAEVDIAILALPLNAQTRGMFDADRFAKMRPGSYFINVARGQVVVESALVDALDSGHLRGAGVDVTEVEPLPDESPLWDRENVIITPHVGAQSRWRVDDTTVMVCENLRRFQAGESLYNTVDKQLGFPSPEVVWHG